MLQVGLAKEQLKLGQQITNLFIHMIIKLMRIEPLEKIELKKVSQHRLIIGFSRITRARPEHREIKIKKFTYFYCSIINIGINTHEIH